MQAIRFSAIHVDPQKIPAAMLQEAEPKNPSHLELHSLEGKHPLVVAVHQNASSPTDVFVSRDKSGTFYTRVKSHGLTYLLFPGSHLTLPQDTDVDMPGEIVPGKANGPMLPETHTPVQQVTDQVMILGAGLATRFDPVSGDSTGFPKPSVPLIGENSAIVAQVNHLKAHGFKHFIVNTYYMPHQVKAQLDKIPGITLSYVDEDTPSGTAGGAYKALDSGKVDKQKPLLIMPGDAFTNADISLLLNAHVKHQANATLGAQVIPDEDVNRFGIISADQTTLDSSDHLSGVIQSFKEKPSIAEAGPDRLGNTGFYVLSPEAMDQLETMGRDYLAQGREFDFAKDFFPRLLETPQSQSERIAHPMLWVQALSGAWRDIGNPLEYIATVRDIFAGRFGVKLPKRIKDFYEHNVIFWPGTKALSESQHADVSGNAIVAKTPGT